MSGRQPHITAGAMLRVLLRAGWYIDRQASSHVHLMHPEKPGRRVTVARHAGAILSQAGLSREEFRRLL